MGNACLGQPRKNAQLMRRREAPDKRYKSVPADKVVSSVAGESDGNKLKIKVNLITCAICMQKYNVSTREPQIVCPNNHTYCKQCATQSFRTNRKCPECRVEMRNPIRNRDIFQLVQDNQNIIEEDKLEPLPEELGDELKLTVSLKDNECINDFWVQGTRVMKIQNNMVWEGFISEETLPKDRQASYSLKVVASRFGNIKVGIVGKGYICQRGVVSKEAVVYHLADGKVLEGGRGQGSEWKGRGEKMQFSPGTELILTCRVNPNEGRVMWFQGDRMLGQARFSKFLKEHEFVAYVLLCHKGDIVDFSI